MTNTQMFKSGFVLQRECSKMNCTVYFSFCFGYSAEFVSLSKTTVRVRRHIV